MNVSALIHRFVEEMPSIRPLGLSHRLTLEKIAKSWLGEIQIAELHKTHVIRYCRERTDICPATKGQYITYLAGVLKFAGSAWDDCQEISDAPIAAAKPFLNKHGLIGKSTPRDRRPSLEEIERLLALFAEQNKRPKNAIDMVQMTRWQLASSRRVGESCALLWKDWDRENHTILVRKMKDPRNHNKQKWVALPAEAQAMLCELWDSKTGDRIFPYNSHSVSARYTEAKKILGIVNLRLHDSRRDCASKLIERGFSAEEVIGLQYIYLTHPANPGVKDMLYEYTVSGVQIKPPFRGYASAAASSKRGCIATRLSRGGWAMSARSAPRRSPRTRSSATNTSANLGQIEVTPLMLEAGLNAYHSWQDSDDYREPELVRSVFLAMARVCPESHRLYASRGRT